MVAVQSGNYQKHEGKKYHGYEEFLSLDYTLFLHIAFRGKNHVKRTFWKAIRFLVLKMKISLIHDIFSVVFFFFWINPFSFREKPT